jgi:16S rRNA processing protein RimM
MSDERSGDDQLLVIVAHALRTRGLKGEIVAELLTDFPERFDGVNELIAVSPRGERRVVELESHWFQKDRVILKFLKFDNAEAAQTLVGFDFAVPESERVALPENQYYDWELEGCKVIMPGGESIGEVESVLKTGAAPVLVVKGEAGSEKLIPLAASVIRKIDQENKSIVIDPPDGLLEL